MVGPPLRSGPAKSVAERVAQGVEMATTIESKFHSIERTVKGDNLKVGDTVPINSNAQPGAVIDGAHGRKYESLGNWQGVVIEEDTIK